MREVYKVVIQSTVSVDNISIIRKFYKIVYKSGLWISSWCSSGLFCTGLTAEKYKVHSMLDSLSNFKIKFAFSFPMIYMYSNEMMKMVIEF